MERVLRKGAVNDPERNTYRNLTNDIYHTPLLLPIRALPGSSRPALSASLFTVRQKRDGNVLRPLRLHLRLITVTQHMGVITRPRDGLRRR